MKVKLNPLVLKNAPLHYAPVNEAGVVFLFATLAKKLNFEIDLIRSGYPDCVAHKGVGDARKKVYIEFEYKSSNFRLHKHDPKKCDYIICWHHDWPDVRVRSLPCARLCR